MKWIGLTGGIATGKSTVASLLRSRSYVVVDADRIVHELTAKNGEGLQFIIQEFGAEFLRADGTLDRALLAQKVFSDAVQLKKLEMILHPLVRQKVLDLRRDLESANVAVAFYDVPLLFEKNLEKDFDAVVVVASDPEIQRQRLKARNSWSDDEIAKRLAAQWDLQDKITKASYVIRNDEPMTALEAEVDKMLEFVKNLKSSN